MGDIDVPHEKAIDPPARRVEPDVPVVESRRLPESHALDRRAQRRLHASRGRPWLPLVPDAATRNVANAGRGSGLGPGDVSPPARDPATPAGAPSGRLPAGDGRERGCPGLAPDRSGRRRPRRRQLRRAGRPRAALGAGGRLGTWQRLDGTHLEADAADRSDAGGVALRPFEALDRNEAEPDDRRCYDTADFETHPRGEVSCRSSSCAARGMTPLRPPRHRSPPSSRGRPATPCPRRSWPRSISSASTTRPRRARASGSRPVRGPWRTCRTCWSGIAKSDIEVIEPLPIEYSQATPAIVRPSEAMQWLNAHHTLSPIARHALVVLETSTPSTWPSTPSCARSSTARSTPPATPSTTRSSAGPRPTGTRSPAT